MIRCYGRMSIFIGCFALFALALLWEELRTRLPASCHRLAGQSTQAANQTYHNQSFGYDAKGQGMTPSRFQYQCL